jgi:zeaxanthin glucosyltransferase
LNNSVVILCYHGKSHFNACFALARALQATHRVTFAGAAYFKAYVTGQGFNYHSLQTVPFGFGLEPWVATQQKRTPIYWHALKDRWSDYLYRAREAELRALLQEYKPGMVLLDAYQSTDFIVLHPLLQAMHIRLALIQVQLPSGLLESAAGKWKRTWRQKLSYFGMDDTAIINRRIRRNNIGRHHFSRSPVFYGCLLENIPEFVLMPEAFDLPGAPLSTLRHYAGLHIDHERKEHTTLAYLKAREAIMHRAATQNARVIYCSFGTVPPHNQAPIKAFLARLIQATATMPVSLLISTSLIPAESPDLPAHAFAVPEVPQLEVLQYTDAFVTHGGTNSVKEAIEQQVPMLVYTVETRIDQPGNARRIAHYGLGLTGTLEGDTVESIADKLTKLLSEPSFKEKLQTLKQQCDGYTMQALIDGVLGGVV